MFRFVLAALFACVLSTPALAITRSCDAKIHWQTTGGSLSGNFGKKMGELFADRAFTRSASCGRWRGNTCRRNARDALMRCLAAHRDAVRASSNGVAAIPSACNGVQNYDYGWAHIARQDVMKRVAAEVCCRGDMQNFNFSDEDRVFINLWAQVSGSNRHCRAQVPLANNMRVNCTVARRRCPDLKE